MLSWKKMMTFVVLMIMVRFRHGRFGSWGRRWQPSHWKCWSKVSWKYYLWQKTTTFETKIQKKWDTNTLRAACLKILIETKIQKTIETEIFSGLPAASSRRWRPPPPGNQRRASTLYRERSKNKFTETRYFLSLKSYAFEVLFSLFPLNFPT